MLDAPIREPPDQEISACLGHGVPLFYSAARRVCAPCPYPAVMHGTFREAGWCGKSIRWKGTSRVDHMGTSRAALER